MAFKWTDELKTEIKSIYLAKMEEFAEANPEADPGTYTREAVEVAAESIGASIPSARMQLTKLDVYVKVKNAATSAAKPAAEGTKRVGKAEAQGELLAAFAACGVEDLDSDIVAKLTGKAAAHLAEKVREVAANLTK